MRVLQQLFLEMKKDVFVRKGLFELANTAKLESYLKLFLGRDEDMKENSETRTK